MSQRVICDLCGIAIPPHAHYIIKMDIFADPAMPQIDLDELEEKDTKGEMIELLNEMAKLSDDELQDMVSRQFEFRICRPCQAQFLANPLGKPRQRKTREN